MKAFIFKDKINLSPMPVIRGGKIWVITKNPLNKHSEPRCYTDIVEKRKVYSLPCPRRNIRAIYIK